jgi:hypothetical protein
MKYYRDRIKRYLITLFIMGNGCLKFPCAKTMIARASGRRWRKELLVYHGNYQ